MTKIVDIPFSQSSIHSLKSTPLTKDWPVVYILEDGKSAYVGETYSAHHRFKQHAKNAEKSQLTSAHVVTDETFNKSAALDTESWLIQYMAADGQFTLLNGNKGLTDHSYYDRELYRSKFEVLWTELQRRGLASSDLIHLRNLDVFKYSPYKALTDEQMDIVIKVEEGLHLGVSKTYIVNGDPGTGKSVLAAFLVKYLIESTKTPDISVALVIPMTSLRSTLRRVFKQIKGLSSSMVIAPNQVMGKHYDLLIVDEAHRLRQRKNLSGYAPYDAANRHYDLGNEGTQLDWILRASKSQVLLFDEDQSVMPGDIPSSMIKALDAERLQLTSQLRVQGGDDYIEFINDLLHLRPTRVSSFSNYEFTYFDRADDMIDTIKQRDLEHGLARTVAGYAWEWKTKKSGEEYDIELDGLKLKWNSTNIDWVNSPDALNEIGCIHTVQGYDLNYVGVIIGPELRYDEDNHRLIIDQNEYKDFNGKRSLGTPEELDKYIVNIYKTLLTRGIKGTYVHAVDRPLAKYLKSKISV